MTQPIPADQFVGRRFGRLTPVHEAARSKRGERRWTCLCECGATAVVFQSVLRNGSTNSCGCLRKEVTRARKTTHGNTQCKSPTPEYQAWRAMKRRCYSPHGKDYPHYGGRGVTVCERWLHSFENFLADMGERPTTDHSIDRVDVNGNYEPGNCRWATDIEQARNHRNNALVTFEGKTMCIAAWAEEKGIPASLVSTRLIRGWDVARSLSPVTTEYGRTFLELDGVSLPLGQWAKKTGIGRATIAARLRSGLTVREALITPVKSR